MTTGAGGEVGDTRLYDAERAERLRTARVLLVAGAVLIAIALVVSIALRPTPVGGHLIYALMLALHLGSLALVRAGYLRLGAAVYATTYLAVALLAVGKAGGNLAPAGFVLPPLVLFVGLTLGGRQAMAVSIAAALGMLGVLALAEGGYLPDPRDTPPIRLALVATTTLLITGVMLLVALQIVRSSRARAAAAEAARRAMEEQLLGARRLETVARLSAGVAHDFNNVLTIVFAEVTRLERAGATSASLDNIRDAADRAAALVRQLLSFGRRQLRNPERVELGEVTANLSRLLARLVGDEIEFTTERGDEPAVLDADRTELEQILLNLVTNARDAMPTGGSLVVRTGVATAALRARCPEPLDAAVFLAVSDTGTGIDPAIRDRLFEPFVTTKEVGKGTGLGLATIATIVERAGGAVLVDSERGAGTTFTVVLPRAGGASASSPRAEPAARERARVLVVDDDALVRDAIAAIIESGGHTVTAAGTSADALDAVATATEPFDLLVTDVMMPDRPGPDLARELRERQAALRVLFLSGYPEQRLSEHGVLAPGVHFLAKPVHAAVLLETIARVLASDNPGALRADSPRSTGAPAAGP